MDEPQAQAGEPKQSAQKQATGLKGLVPAKFGTLSAAENLMLEKAATGDVANCSELDDKGDDPKKANDWTPKRRIRAELVAWLCMNEQARKQVHLRGIQVYGADVTGPLDLSFVNIPFQLMLRHCRLEEDLNLSRAEVSELDLQGSLVHGIQADGLIVKNDVFLRRGFTTNGEVRLLGAQIGGDLDCIAGTFTNERGSALSADGINVKGDVDLRDGFAATGAVGLPGAQIGGDLDCSRGTFTNKSGDALNAERTIVKGSVFLNDGFTAEGGVYLVGAQIGSSFACQDANFQKATLDLRDASAGTLVDSGLNDIRRGETADYRPTLWPPGDTDKSNNKKHYLLLDGFTYGRIASRGRTDVDKRLGWLERQPQTPFHPKPYLQLAKVVQESGDSDGALRIKERMEELRYSEHDNWVAAAESRILRATIGYGYYPLRALKWEVGLGLLGWIVYRRSYLAGTMAPSDKEAYKDFKDPTVGIPANYPKFSPLIYSVENSLPLVKLGQGDKWHPDPPWLTVPPQKRAATEFAYRAKWGWVPSKLRSGGRVLTRGLAAVWGRAPKWLPTLWAWVSAKTTSPRFVMWFLWIQILLGWLLATLFVAGVSGIVHKE